MAPAWSTIQLQLGTFNWLFIEQLNNTYSRFVSVHLAVFMSEYFLFKVVLGNIIRNM